MSVETQTHGLSDWQFPSPSASPKVQLARHAPSHTPKSEYSSHFADAFRTPQSTEPQTAIRTPGYSTLSWVRKPLFVKNNQLAPDDPQFHINHFADNKLLLPPVNPSQRLSSSPDPRGTSAALQKTLSATKEHPEGNMDPFQMQTPPPTRGSSTRRQYSSGQHQFQHPAGNMQHGHASTPARNATEGTPNLQLQTPVQYPGWHLSPDMYQFQPGPASAPAMPNTRLPWDQSPLLEQYHPGFGDPGQSPFGTMGNMGSQIPNWQPQNESPVHIQNSFPQSSPMPPTQESDFWTTNSTATQLDANKFTQDVAFSQTTTGVNPSLIFSFSSPAQSSVAPPAPMPLGSMGLGSRQPYEQQTRELTKEREHSKKAKQQHQSRALSALTSAIRPSLQRSNTDSGFRRLKPRSADSRSLNLGQETIPRKPSPLKRLSQASLTSIPESFRPARSRTRLVVDETGTARTETVPDDEFTFDKRRSFTQWPDDSESSEDDPIIASQRSSFVSLSDATRPAKHARVDSEIESFDISKRPLSSASLSSLTSRFASTPLGHRSAMDPSRRISHGSASGLLNMESDSFSSQDTILADGNGDGDAQNALKRLVEGRLRRDPLDPNSTIKPRRAATNPVRSSSAIDITKFPSPPSPQLSYGRPTSSVHTPTTDRSSRSGDSTRCVCGVTDDSGSEMIQCESCAKWLHVICVFGKRIQSRELKLPGVYVCAFCTGQLRHANTTPASDLLFSEQLGPAFEASPLGYKSGFAG